MMRVFYASPAVSTNGSEEIFGRDFDYCIDMFPYLEGYVFEQENIICGYSMLAKGFSTEVGKACIWIEDIYIKPEYRSLGIGRHFFEFLKAEYPDVLFKLEVEEENTKAVQMYEKTGFSKLPYMVMVMEG